MAGISSSLSLRVSVSRAAPAYYSPLRNYFYFCSHKAQENINNIIFIMVLRGV